MIGHHRYLPPLADSFSNLYKKFDSIPSTTRSRVVQHCGGSQLRVQDSLQKISLRPRCFPKNFQSAHACVHIPDPAALWPASPAPAPGPAFAPPPHPTVRQTFLTHQHAQPTRTVPPAFLLSLLPTPQPKKKPARGRSCQAAHCRCKASISCCAASTAAFWRSRAECFSRPSKFCPRRAACRPSRSEAWLIPPPPCPACLLPSRPLPPLPPRAVAALYQAPFVGVAVLAGLLQEKRGLAGLVGIQNLARQGCGGDLREERLQHLHIGLHVRHLETVRKGGVKW